MMGFLEAQQKFIADLGPIPRMFLGAVPYVLFRVLEQFDCTRFHFEPGAVIAAHKLGAGAFGNVWDASVTTEHGTTLTGALKDGTANAAAMWTLTNELAIYANLKALPGLGRVLAYAPNRDGTAVRAILYEKLTCSLLDDIKARREVRLSTAPEDLSPLYSPLELWTFITRMAKLLKKMHELDFYHCDIKPDNIMLDDAGVAYLIDLGIAVYAPSGVMVTGPRGTPGFSLPTLEVSGEVEPHFSIDTQPLALTVLMMMFSWPPDMAREEARNGGLSRRLGAIDSTLYILVSATLDDKAELRIPLYKWINKGEDRIEELTPAAAIADPPAPAMSELPPTPPHSIMAADSSAASTHTGTSIGSTAAAESTDSAASSQSDIAQALLQYADAEMSEGPTTGASRTSTSATSGTSTASSYALSLPSPPSLPPSFCASSAMASSTEHTAPADASTAPASLLSSQLSASTVARFDDMAAAQRDTVSSGPHAAALCVTANPCFAAAATGGKLSCSSQDGEVADRLASLPQLRAACREGAPVGSGGLSWGLASEAETPYFDGSGVLSALLPSPRRAPHRTLDSELGLSVELARSPCKAAAKVAECGGRQVGGQKKRRWGFRALSKALKGRLGCLAASECLE